MNECCQRVHLEAQMRRRKKDSPFISSKVIGHLQYNVIYRQSDKYEI